MVLCVKEQDWNFRKRAQWWICMRMEVGCRKQTWVGGVAREQLHVVGEKIRKSPHFSYLSAWKCSCNPWGRQGKPMCHEPGKAMDLNKLLGIWQLIYPCQTVEGQLKGQGKEKSIDSVTPQLMPLSCFLFPFWRAKPAPNPGHLQDLSQVPFS